MADRRKQKRSLRGEQFNLWDGAQVSNKEKTVDIDQGSDISDNYKKQNELDFLTQELTVTKKNLSILQRKLEKEKTINDENKLDYLRKLVSQLPALLLFEVLKTISLKETKEVIKPLKPTAGIAISTNRSIKKLGTTIGLPPSRTDKALQLLLNTGFVKKSGLGALDLGQFSQDKKGSIFPMWYRDITNPDHIMLLFSSKGAFPEK